MKVTRRNGSTFGRIPCARDWLGLGKIGGIKARPFVSTARECYRGACPHAQGPRSAAEGSRRYNDAAEDRPCLQRRAEKDNLIVTNCFAANA